MTKREIKLEGIMKGNNTLELNQATMIEAVQVWVDKSFVKPPQVLGVSKRDEYTFTVTISSEDAPS
jgi:hypothetical protein